MARVGHRPLGSVVSVIALAGSALIAAAPPSAAATCEVTNTGTDTTYRTLQGAVDGSEEGDTLEVRGTCVGKTIIRTTQLRLKGIPTTEQPTPTLDGAQLSRVLAVVSSKVVIRDLAITNGEALYGGGIFVDRDPSPGTARSRVTLAGDTSVAGNTAEVYGGGILNDHDDGTLILNDSASVTGNTARNSGGGIYNDDDTLILNDSASVTGNTARNSGGGIYNDDGGTLVLNDTASVSGNTVRQLGGGIYVWGTLILNDSASVTGNTSANDAGGIYNFFGTVALNGSASVSGNRAKDEGGGMWTISGAVTLKGSSSVTGNTAEGDGGGIHIYPIDPVNSDPSRVYVCTDQVAISPNDPDDPPKVRHVCP